MKHLDPFNTHSSPSNTAFVCCPCASVPAPGSVRPKAPNFLPDAKSGIYFFFCSSVPKVWIGSIQRDVCAETTTPVVASSPSPDAKEKLFFLLAVIVESFTSLTS